MGLGGVFLVLAFIGVFLPLIPTTPFLLAAAASFSRSSDRFHNWLLNNRLFGHYISDYQDKKGVPLRIKISTLVFLWVSILVSVILFTDELWLRILLFIIAAGVTIHILLIRTKRQ